ncbi:hypothetical protein H0I76_14120 [Limibaculum sp. M0105]|uniref:Uncharacterized protein n=1 Tax=Thermohalobaculum xanthum TaxID=2753746 RepID=A0A8J7SGR6_9RHOB|nr:hypothetical protein [Thermohalobaculum xanthum]MBK0400332.1 hypothetical protein [Thermohalobaculum xanthum]
MPHQNRVLPTGEIVAAPWRGAFTGNRGCLHDAGGRLGAVRWRHQNWVCCLTAFRGRWRPIMPPGRWTALFFWDEAAALAAGHRPCGECRHADYRRFMAAWEAAGLPGRGLVERDRVLHRARVTRDRRQVTHRAEAGKVPDGAFIRADGVVALAWRGAAIPWDGGYGAPAPLPDGMVEVLTPVPVVAVLRAGYELSPAFSTRG